MPITVTNGMVRICRFLMEICKDWEGVWRRTYYMRRWYHLDLRRLQRGVASVRGRRSRSLGRRFPSEGRG